MAETPDLTSRRAKTLIPGSPEAVERQHARGKYTARERLEKLLDPGTFRELDPFARHRASGFGMETKRPYTDGVVTGWGAINGRKVFVYSQDFTVFGGALGAVHAEKIVKVMDLAQSVGAPLIGLNDGGGARIQEGVASLNGYSEIFRRNVSASGVIPQISVIMGPCAGGAVYSPAMTDFVFMVEGSANMYITGPDVVQTVTGESVTHEELGGARAHATKSGVATFVYPDEDTTLRAVRDLLDFLPQKSGEPIAKRESRDDPERSCKALRTLVPEDPRAPYDVHTLLSEIADDGEFMELQSLFAPNMVCALARIGGHAVGIVANEPEVLAGALDIDASEKAARFVRTCDAFGIPMVSIVDVPGFRPGLDQEQGGVIRHGAKLLYAFCEATVPRIQIITRRALGGAYVVMNSRATGADLCYAWPNAEIAVMSAPAAVEVLHHRDIELAGDPEAKRGEFIDEYNKEFAHPFAAAERGLIDDIIEPEDTRRVIVSGLELLASKSQPSIFRKHANVPL